MNKSKKNKYMNERGWDWVRDLGAREKIRNQKTLHDITLKGSTKREQ